MNEIEETEYEDTALLANRWQRLWASLIDALIMMAVTIPAMYFTGGFSVIEEGREPSLIYGLMIAVVGVVFFVLINGKLLMSHGQTIGKKVLNIKIVDMEDNLPTQNHFIKRYAMFFGLGQVPVAGPLLSLINILVIFGKEKRCGHDYFAETKVVTSEA